MKEHFGDDERGRRKAWYFFPWHFDFFCRRVCVHVCIPVRVRARVCVRAVVHARLACVGVCPCSMQEWEEEAIGRQCLATHLSAQLLLPSYCGSFSPSHQLGLTD